MAKNKSGIKKLDDIVDEAYKRFRLALEAESDNHKRAEEAIKFRDLDQWPQKVRDARENDPEGARPCLVVDKINQYLNQVKNDQRQNRPQIKVKPVDDKGDPEVAKVYDGIIRHIQDCSRASIAYDTAHEHATDGGFGYWRIVTEYIDEDTFDQEPRIERIRNRFSVLLDPAHQQPDGSDAKWGFVFESLTHDEFKAQYPGKKECSFEEYGNMADGWVGDDYLIVAEYFKIIEAHETLTIGNRSRKVPKRSVKWYKLTAAEVLDERDWPGKWVPIVEVIGNEIDIKGKRKLSGLVRGAMDAMRMYNYASSAFVEMVALAPRAPWVAAEGQIEGREADWKSANRRNISVLQYKPVMENDQLVSPPMRMPMPGIPTGWQQAMANFEHDVQASMGMYASNLGEQTQATSGRQEMALQKRGDTATFHYTDNLSYSIQHTGRILIDLIPKLYDTERVVRILGEDDSDDFVRLNPEQEQAVKPIVGADGRKVEYFNLSIGKYDVTPTVGPAYTTRRQEAADLMVQMVTAKPELLQVIGDIMFRNMDVPGGDEIAERMKKMLPPQLQEQPDMDSLPPDVREAILQAQSAIEQEKQMMAQAAQKIQQMQEQAQQEGMQAKDAKSALQLEAEKLKNAQDRLNAAEQVLDARMAATEAEQGAAIKEAVTSIKDMLRQHEAQVMSLMQTNQEGQEQAQNQEVASLVMQSHQQMMEAVMQIVGALTAPKVRTVVGPSGQQYQMTEQVV